MSPTDLQEGSEVGAIYDSPVDFISAKYRVDTLRLHEWENRLFTRRDGVRLSVSAKFFKVFPPITLAAIFATPMALLTKGTVLAGGSPQIKISGWSVPKRTAGGFMRPMT